MCVHSSITPFMKQRDSHWSECRWAALQVTFLACSMSKWGLLLLTADSIWSSPSLSLRPISRAESEAWPPVPGWEHEERSPIWWSLSGECRSWRPWVSSRSERLSKLPGAFFTNSWPIRKESVWKSWVCQWVICQKCCTFNMSHVIHYVRNQSYLLMWSFVVSFI